MPRKPLRPSVADRSAAKGGSAAVDKALSLLRLFATAEGPLSLTDCAERATLYKSTALRLLSSLEHSQLVARLPDGRYALGPEVARLAAAYRLHFSLESVVVPVLRELVRQTNESAAYYVRHADQRLCQFRIDSPRIVRDHARVGDLMPLDRGAAGRLMMAYAGAQGALYDRIRRERHAVLSGDRVADVAGIAAPVFDVTGQLAGALTLTMPAHRLDTAQVPHVVAAASRLSLQLGASRETAAPAAQPAAH
jgi:DNA-binding IclR family transcriptional regulator